ncbi:MAG: hypothetical protein K6G08_07655 [Prevotella sp.]|nr:hypothetical protein [Prevotella sp.]
MKKLILSSLVLMTALVAQAQMKIAPKLEKGFKAVYVETGEINSAGTAMKATAETQYVVTDVTATGAVIEVTQLTSDVVPTDASAPNPMAEIMAAATKATSGVTIKVATDADGQPLKILNIDEVQTQSKKALGAILDPIYAKMPQLAQAAPKETLIEQLSSKLKEESLISGMKNSVDVMSLNGKTVANGATDEYTNQDGMKMKRMYFVMGKNVICNSNLSMTKDELKAFIIQQVEKEAPEQAKMIKDNIDMVVGAMKFEMNEKGTYEFQENGWPKSIKTEKKQELMGQTMNSKSVITLKQ